LQRCFSCCSLLILLCNIAKCEACWLMFSKKQTNKLVLNYSLVLLVLHKVYAWVTLFWPARPTPGTLVSTTWLRPGLLPLPMPQRINPLWWISGPTTQRLTAWIHTHTHIHTHTRVFKRYGKIKFVEKLINALNITSPVIPFSFLTFSSNPYSLFENFIF